MLCTYRGGRERDRGRGREKGEEQQRKEKKRRFGLSAFFCRIFALPGALESHESGTRPFSQSNHTHYSHVVNQILILDNIRSENATNRAECGIRIRTIEGQWAPCCSKEKTQAANDCSTKLACFHLQKFNLMSTLFLMQPPVISYLQIDGWPNENSQTTIISALQTYQSNDEVPVFW
jgi:hypothetical protein